MSEERILEYNNTFWQARTASFPSWTVHDPQTPSPQPNFVPVRPRWSLRTQRRGVSGATSMERFWPLTVSWNGMGTSREGT